MTLSPSFFHNFQNDLLKLTPKVLCQKGCDAFKRTSGPGREKMAELYRKTATDEAFRNLCLQEPREAIRQIFGQELPQNFRICFVDNMPATISRWSCPICARRASRTRNNWKRWRAVLSTFSVWARDAACATGKRQDLPVRTAEKENCKTKTPSAGVFLIGSRAPWMRAFLALKRCAYVAGDLSVFPSSCVFRQPPNR